MNETQSLERSMKRARDLYEGGACNIRAISGELGRAIETGFAETQCNGGETIKAHPAYAPARLILAQLAFLFGQGIGDYPGVETDLGGQPAMSNRLTGD